MLPSPGRTREAASRGLHSPEAGVAREGAAAGAQTPAKPLQEPPPRHCDGGRKGCSFRTASWQGAGPADRGRCTGPGDPPAPHRRRAGHVLPPSRAGLAWASLHSLGVSGDRPPAAGPGWGGELRNRCDPTETWPAPSRVPAAQAPPPRGRPRPRHRRSSWHHVGRGPAVRPAGLGARSVRQPPRRAPGWGNRTTSPTALLPHVNTR